jgi:hypothetical protein
MNNHDHGFKLGEWTFADPENVAAICCRHILEGKDILRVAHDEEDGCWQILCGESHVGEDANVVCLACMVKRDNTVLELADLPLGWCADREDTNSPWERAVNPPDDNENS